MHLAGIGKYTQFSGIDTVYDPFILCICSLFISLISCHIHCFGIAETIHQEDNFLFFYFLFFIDSLLAILYNGAAFARIFLFEMLQIFNDNFCHRIIIIQNVFISCNIFQSLLMIFHQRFNFQTNEFVETHFQDCICLALSKTEHRSHFPGNPGFELDIFGDSLCQTGSCISHRLASPQDFNNQVNDVTRFDKTFLNFFFVPLFCKQCLIFSCCQFELKIYMVFDNFLKPHSLRTSICNSQHIYPESIFQSCLFIEHIGQILNICPFFQLNNNAYSFL